MLDAHNHPRYPTGLVENYMLDWWAASVIKPSPELLSHETLDKCLLVHHKQREAEMASARSAEVAMDMAPQASILERLGQLPTCKCCNLYRNLAVGTGEDVQHLYRELKRLDQEVANQTASTKRRASAFNRLFEAAVLKETHDTASISTSTSTPVPTPSTSAPTPSTAEKPVPSRANLKWHLRERIVATPQESVESQPPGPPPKIPRKLTLTKLAEIMQYHYRADRVRLENEPCLKWTWGVDLNDNDVRGLFRAGDRDYKPPHSGYDESLREGNFPGEYSVGPSSAFIPPPSPKITPGTRPSDTPELAPNDIPHHFRAFPLHRPRAVVPRGALPHGD
ncbi:hypothetical protein BGW80DRAFT_1469795, partial [Lactifluus volemus]